MLMVKVFADERITTLAREMVIVRKRMGVDIQARFNDTVVICVENSTAQTIINDYYGQRDST